MLVILQLSKDVPQTTEDFQLLEAAVAETLAPGKSSP